METKIGFLLLVCLASFPACRQSSNTSNSNNPAHQNSNISKPVNANSLEINREDLKRETEKVKKDLDETRKKFEDPKAKSDQTHENLQDSQIKNDTENK